MWKSETCTVCNLVVLIAGVGVLMVAFVCAVCKDCATKLCCCFRKRKA